MATPTLDDRLFMRHRPEKQAPVMYQKWRDLLFLHWEIPPAMIQATLPPGLRVDTYEGKAYLGIVPFFMQDVRPRFFPAVPGLSDFPELNLRTYVFDKAGTPGVWFYALEAGNNLAVRIARRFFHLPYYHATMSLSRDPDTGFIDYHSRRADDAYTCRFRYRAEGRVQTSVTESLDFFLVERYVLFAWDPHNRRLLSGRVHHAPYPLRTANVASHSDALFIKQGFPRPQHPPDHVTISEGVDVTIYGLREIKAGVYYHPGK